MATSNPIATVRTMAGIAATSRIRPSATAPASTRPTAPAAAWPTSATDATNTAAGRIQRSTGRKHGVTERTSFLPRFGKSDDNAVVDRERLVDASGGTGPTRVDDRKEGRGELPGGHVLGLAMRLD